MYLYSLPLYHIYLFINPPTYPLTYSSTYLPIYPSTYLSTFPSTYVSTHPPIYLSIYLFTLLYFSTSSYTLSPMKISEKVSSLQKKVL